MVENSQKSTHIIMVHVTEKLYLSQCSFGINSIVKSISNLLNRYFFTCLWVHSSTVSHEKESNSPQYEKKQKFAQTQLKFKFIQPMTVQSTSTSLKLKAGTNCWPSILLVFHSNLLSGETLVNSATKSSKWKRCQNKKKKKGNRK